MESKEHYSEQLVHIIIVWSLQMWRSHFEQQVFVFLSLFAGHREHLFCFFGSGCAAAASVLGLFLWFLGVGTVWGGAGRREFRTV